MEIKEIKNWFEIAIPEPTIEQAAIQIGCHYEEVAEMFEPLSERSEVEDALSGLAGEYKRAGHDHVEHLSMMVPFRKLELLDSLCDQIVTAIGVAHMLGMDIEGALANVNASNFSKFENGLPVFNEQGKISKGKDYQPPQLGEFI